MGENLTVATNDSVYFITLNGSGQKRKLCLSTSATMLTNQYVHSFNKHSIKKGSICGGIIPGTSRRRLLQQMSPLKWPQHTPVVL